MYGLVLLSLPAVLAGVLLYFGLLGDGSLLSWY